MAEHESKIIELRRKLAPEVYVKNMDIIQWIPKRSDHSWLKRIAIGEDNYE